MSHSNQPPTIKPCIREGCNPVYIEREKFIRCLTCGAWGPAQEKDKAIELWNDAMEFAKEI